MFDALYDSLSMIFSSSWPLTDGVVTAANVRRDSSGDGKATFALEIAYKFSLGDDGPYVGLSAWRGALSDEQRARDAMRAFQVGQTVLLRYRRSDPSVNKIDSSAWQGL
jgi:hypothetical protein